MYKVEGYEFETKEQAENARKEVDGVRYIRSQSGLDDPDTVLKLYNKLVLKEVFATPIGLGFLHELQEYLHTIPYIKNEDILPIPVYRPEPEAQQDEREEKEISRRAKKRRAGKTKVIKKARRRQNRDYKKLFHISTFFAVVFLCVIAGMFFITGMSDDNVNIVNYENELINKYEKWEQKLDEREQELEEKEQALGRQEADGS